LIISLFLMGNGINFLFQQSHHIKQTQINENTTYNMVLNDEVSDDYYHH